MKRTSRRKFYYLIIPSVLIIALILFQFFKLATKESAYHEISQDIQVPPYHAHADFKVFLDGEEFSLNKSSFDVANRYIHLHLRNPDGDKVIHMEGMENITLKIFFGSLGITFNASCFILDTDESFCNTLDKRIRFFVNGKENFQFDFYEPRNLDRILIVYGNETDEEIMQKVENVTDYACIYSNRCPERITELPVPEEQLIF